MYTYYYKETCIYILISLWICFYSLVNLNNQLISNIFIEIYYEFLWISKKQSYYLLWKYKIAFKMKSIFANITCSIIIINERPCGNINYLQYSKKQYCFLSFYGLAHHDGSFPWKLKMYCITITSILIV